MHRRPTALCNRQKTSKLRGVFQVDHNGIHSETSSNCLEIHTHDQHGELTRVATYDVSHSVARPPRMFGAYCKGQTIYAAESHILAVRDGKLTRMLDTGYFIHDIAYHAHRESYLVTVSNGVISEFDADFDRIRNVQYDRLINVHPVPSNCSSTIYTAWYGPSGVGLGISQQNETEYIRLDKTCCPRPMLLARPAYSDVLMTVYDRTISIIDMWHSSSNCRQNHHHHVRLDYCGVHLDPNVCILSNGFALFVFDYRYGFANPLTMTKYDVFDIWGVDGRLYASCSSGLQMFI